MRRTSFGKAAQGVTALLIGLSLAACGRGEQSGGLPATVVPPTGIPATNLPATVVPPTGIPATNLPATVVPPTGIPATNLPATVVPTTPTPVLRPTIAFNPKGGAPGTQVTMTGWGFRPNSMVVVRLGLPKPVGEALNSAPVGPDGRFSATFIMPSHLPSGEPIRSTEMRLVAMSEDNVALASAPFAFQPSAAPNPADADEPVRSFLGALLSGGDPWPYLSRELRDQIVGSGQDLDVLLNVQPGYQGFTVVEPYRQDSGVLIVAASVQYARQTQDTLFGMVEQGGQWRIASIQNIVYPADPTPTPVPPHSETFESAYQGDINADGIAEQVLYSRAKVQVGIGFTEPPTDRVVMVADQVRVLQLGAEGRELLIISRDGIFADGQMIEGFASVDFTPPGGFLVALLTSEPISSFIITPVDQNGVPWATSITVQWSQLEYGYRVVR